MMIKNRLLHCSQVDAQDVILKEYTHRDPVWEFQHPYYPEILTLSMNETLNFIHSEKKRTFGTDVGEIKDKKKVEHTFTSRFL